jgi:hypothetical protein
MDKNTSIHAAAVSAGLAAGAAAAPTIAGAVGATSIPLLTTIGSWVGVSIVAATPLGWFIGLAVAGGAVAAAASALIQEDAKTEGAIQILRQVSKDRQNLHQRQQSTASLTPEEVQAVRAAINHAVVSNKLESSQGARILDLVQTGAISPKEAITEIVDLSS